MMCQQCSGEFMACLLCLFRQVLIHSPHGSIQSLGKHTVEPFDTAKLQHCTTDKVTKSCIRLFMEKSLCGRAAAASWGLSRGTKMDKVNNLIMIVKVVKVIAALACRLIQHKKTDDEEPMVLQHLRLWMYVHTPDISWWFLVSSNCVWGVW